MTLSRKELSVTEYMRNGGLNDSSRILSFLLLFGIDIESCSSCEIRISRTRGVFAKQITYRQAMFYMLIDEPEHLIFMDDT